MVWRKKKDDAPSDQEAELWAHFADDDPSKRKMFEVQFRMQFRRHYSHLGVKLLPFLYGDGESLVNAVARNCLPVHAIITDWQMPGGDGLYVVRKLQEAGLEQIPLIMVTGASVFEVQLAAHAQGINPDLIRIVPFKVQPFQAAVRDLVEQAISNLTNS